MLRSRALFSLLLCLASPVYAQPNATPPAALIVTATVEQGQPRIPRTFAATAEPRYMARVASEVDGLVEFLRVRRGDQVARGEVIARLRSYPVELQREEARARLGEVQTRIAKAEADLRRARELHSQRIISEEELQARQTELDALLQEASRNQASIRLLQDRLERMSIRAPFSGHVVRAVTELGQWVDEGEAVVELADLSTIQVMTPVPEQHLSQVKLGMQARVNFDALPGGDFSGEVTAVVPQADLASRTFPVQVSVANPEGKILAGMLARVTFMRDLDNPGLVIPKDAYVPRPDGGGYVVKIHRDTARIIPVELLQAAGGSFLVRPLDGSLEAGNRVAIRGNERLREGQQVQEAPGGGGSAP
ncbi:MexH family multidrug efflux RND transporter periplasmic adaptor subunit [Desulfuromonas versatilis]|uniref:MexH family multidrug efflux RND transporter periplasmic adaptor subunit n=1 Tax=Desulfuromonas versatilis TaxID=2802975 RepID=A0ABM8HSH8_9BACT|nr:efflux RND transporter periplasmic adaptor subunit [Desulfuromonas versatilis]BCR03919.1 MexH family multidrug efflux RND transporter periplasmic adaptor subunit [Desulfuromonas versatilis]